MAVDRQNAAADQSVTSRAAIEALFARRQEAWDNLDAAALAGDYTSDAFIDSPVTGRHGKTAAAASFEAVFKGFLDMTMKTEALIIDGNKVAQVMQFEGTNMGSFLGLEPSGRSFSIPAVFTYELRNGQIAREQRIYDFTGVLVQVGLLKTKPV